MNIPAKKAYELSAVCTGLSLYMILYFIYVLEHFITFQRKMFSVYQNIRF